MGGAAVAGRAPGWSTLGAPRWPQSCGAATGPRCCHPPAAARSCRGSRSRASCTAQGRGSSGSSATRGAACASRLGVHAAALDAAIADPDQLLRPLVGVAVASHRSQDDCIPHRLRRRGAAGRERLHCRRDEGQRMGQDVLQRNKGAAGHHLLERGLVLRRLECPCCKLRVQQLQPLQEAGGLDFRPQQLAQHEADTLRAGERLSACCVGGGPGAAPARLGQGEGALHAGAERDAPLAQEKGDVAHDGRPIQQREEPQLLDALQAHAGRGKAEEAAEVAPDVGGAAASLGPLRCRAVQVHGLHQPRLERREVSAQGSLRHVRGCQAVLLHPACATQIILPFLIIFRRPLQARLLAP